jgi:hypothetical protein
LHPTEDEIELKTVYSAILNDLTAKGTWPFDLTRTARYTVRQGVIRTFSRLPIFDAQPRLYEFLQDSFAAPPPPMILSSIDGNMTKELRAPLVRQRKVVKLRDIAEVKIGLQTGNNARFYRVRKGVHGGAVKGGYKEIDPKNIVSLCSLSKLTKDERSNGIKIDDPTNDRYFVPLDKLAESDIEAGILSMFYQPVDFYIDWSSDAVSQMKEMPGAVFRNPEYYFRRGISFSNTGIYSPTFRLSHGGVFDQKGSCIFSDFAEPEFLLGVLSSTLVKYFVKAFINHGVDAQLDDLPIILPAPSERIAIINKVMQIVDSQKKDPGHDFRPELVELDKLIFSLYGLTDSEVAEVKTWYRRRYPALFKPSAPTP